MVRGPSRAIKNKKYTHNYISVIYGLGDDLLSGVGVASILLYMVLLFCCDLETSELFFFFTYANLFPYRGIWMHTDAYGCMMDAYGCLPDA